MSEAWRTLLSPGPAARDALWRQVLERLALFLEERPALPVAPPVDAVALRAALDSEDFRTPRPLPEVVAAVVMALERGMVHTGHPRYFGLFNPPSSVPGQIADLITAVMNPQLAVWSHAAVPVEIERRVIREMGRVLGLGPVSGHFTSGGAEANYTALLLAATAASPDFATEGALAFPGRPVFYASAESHLAWLKIAHQAGLGRSALRLIATDETGRMDPTALGTAIAADRHAGHVPLMVAATAGTTSAGMIDPLPAVADVARAQGLPLHVDAAWAGAAGFSPTLRHHLAGLEHAATVTVDAHKWLAAPMGAGMLLCRDAGLLERTFHVSTGYMPQGGEDDPYTHSMQWSRRFIGLKLYLTLAALGHAGLAAMVEHMTGLGENLRAGLRSRGWTVRNPTPLPVVCVTDDGGADPEAVAERVVQSGGAWVSVVRHAGRPVLRACISGYLTTGDDVAALIEMLEAGRKE